MIIFEDTTWASGESIVINDTIQVAEGATLFIEPGVQVSSGEIVVAGALVSQGDKNSLVQFDGTKITSFNTGTLSIEFSLFENAFRVFDLNGNSDVSIRDSVFSNNYSVFYTTGRFADLDIESNVFIMNNSVFWSSRFQGGSEIRNNYFADNSKIFGTGAAYFSGVTIVENNIFKRFDSLITAPEATSSGEIIFKQNFYADPTALQLVDYVTDGMDDVTLKILAFDAAQTEPAVAELPFSEISSYRINSILGTDESETLLGSVIWDRILAYGGDDTIVSDIFNPNGNDIIDGGAGADTLLLSGPKFGYSVVISSSSTNIEDRRLDGDGTDQLMNIETLRFQDDDGDFHLDIFDNVADLTEQAFRDFVEVYIAYFNRAPDAEGLFFYGTAFANGTSLEASAATFLNSAEYQTTYPPGLNNQEFAEAVYNNVLGRIPDLLGLEFWVGVLDSGARSRDVFILEVLKGAKAPAPGDATQDFIDQKAADVDYLANKTDIGLYFAVTKGMSNVTNATTAMQIFDDGEQSDIDATVAAIDGFYTDALDPSNGEFLLQLVGVVDDPFAIA
ncbi:DUF4214 domain-containing protein [Sulfitobacter mediterraneus]|uniref:DUF4214 domain-containing protein n=1 Tax=Sulfitobacter mediterraneus TaxID=83219 RepID=UPI002492FC1F|nr:DUF4214 domain-containing protein [Sulfitobacter mediterraneus]